MFTVIICLIKSRRQLNYQSIKLTVWVVLQLLNNHCIYIIDFLSFIIRTHFFDLDSSWLLRSALNISSRGVFLWCHSQLSTETEHSFNSKTPLNKLSLIKRERKGVACWYSHWNWLFMHQTHWTWCQQYSSEAIGFCVEHVQTPHHNSLFFWTVVGSEICSRIPHVKVCNCTCYKRAQFVSYSTNLGLQLVIECSSFRVYCINTFQNESYCIYFILFGFAFVNHPSKVHSSHQIFLLCFLLVIPGSNSAINGVTTYTCV